MSPTVRVRFAPSPTGFLHIGGVRTALFNYLFARKEGGSFLLRIEDTDRERSKAEFEQEILDSLRWLGLEWDGTILKQSERLAVYQAMSEDLIKSGFAYRVQEGARNAVKFKVPGRGVQFDDLVHGPIEFDGDAFDDFVIQKSDGFPTYHLACVVDDHEMDISHVIRGDDHISNTPRQLLIYDAFGWKAPRFAHLPLVFGSDRTPLSKRHGAVALSAYRDEGYLPESLLNYLALLGWSSSTGREFLSVEELIQDFSLSGINKTNACFDREKLRWINGEHIRKLSDADYLKRLRAFLSENSWPDHERFPQIALLFKNRIRAFQEFLEQASFFFQKAVSFDEKAVAKHFKGENTRRYLTAWQKALAEEANFSEPHTLETLLRRTAEELGIDSAILIHSTRVAISGRSVTPGLFEVMSLLGKDAILERLHYVIINFETLCSPQREKK